MIVAAIWSPTMIDRALEPSWARVIVRVSPTMAVTRTISALVVRGCVLIGQTVALNGVAGKRVPWPPVTIRDVPELAGLGAVATRLYAKLAWASGKGRPC